MGASGEFEVFQYPAGPEPSVPALAGMAELSSLCKGALDLSGPRSVDYGEAVEEGARQFERKVAEESKRSFEAGREQGLKEGLQAEREAQAAVRAAGESKRSAQIAGLIASFAEERDHYLQAVEHEVVELALAVAARILRREAQMDPLLLTGAVRVALGQLSSSTVVRLRVPEAELSLWSEALGHLPKLALTPELIVAKEMRLGECVVEAEQGSVDLGIRAQLGEIERGFFDRAQQNDERVTAARVETAGVMQEAQP